MADVAWELTYHERCMAGLLLSTKGNGRKLPKRTHLTSEAGNKRKIEMPDTDKKESIT